VPEHDVFGGKGLGGVVGKDNFGAGFDLPRADFADEDAA